MKRKKRIENDEGIMKETSYFSEQKIPLVSFHFTRANNKNIFKENLPNQLVPT